MRPLALALAATALLGAGAAHAAPDWLPDSPVKLIQQPGRCPTGYSEIGYVGPEGARWSICQINGYELPPLPL